MLAYKSFSISVCRFFGVALLLAMLVPSTSWGQQTPSQRYQPVQDNVYESSQPSNDYYPEQVHSEGIKQIAYDHPSQPAVPAVLAGGSARKPTDNSFVDSKTASRRSVGGTTPTLRPQTPADLRSQMALYGATQQPATNDANALPRPKTAAIPVGVVPQRRAPATIADPTFVPARETARQVAISNATTQSPKVQVQSSLTDRVPKAQYRVAPAVNDLRSASAGDGRVARAAVSNTAFHQHPAVQPATPVATAVQDSNVRPVARVEPVREEASIKIAAPAIEVLTIGPQVIGINKTSTYEVVVRNNSRIAASQLLVGVNLPAWVDIENLSMTTGDKEITDGQQRARLVWNIDQIAGNSSQTMTISAIPRKAELFDVGIEWTLVPMVGKATVNVTEPKLEMSISGPQEVQYGETALYHVTVRNPGTGAAENVAVMLPEALGGERATLGLIAAGKEKNFQVELLARTAGDLNLLATATGDGNLNASAERGLIVRRANLEIGMTGPALKYAGGIGKYSITVSNTGDSSATDLMSAIALPAGVKYLKGIDGVKLIDGGMRWPVGSLAPGQNRTYSMFCELNASGSIKLDAGVRGKAGSDLAASGFCMTTVETIADLVLTVEDLKGPLPTGEKVPYTIKVRNRGTKAAQNIDLVMQFSHGIEPHSAKGLDYKIAPGKVVFSPISKIDPGQEMTFEVTAEAYESGNHIFRAQLTSNDSDAREIAEGTTRYFGDPVDPPQMPGQPAANTADAGQNSFFQ